jgi:hypothetical protein
MKRWLAVFIPLFLTILMHLPFIGADPDTQVDINTRGAWTDEGLYASQARNTINGYGFDLKENTTAVRGPLQYYMQVEIMRFLGQERWVLRALTLLFILIALLILSGAAGPLLAMLLIMIGFLQFHLFQFSHYAMAEMMSVSLILMAIAFLAWMVRLKLKHWYLWMFLSTMSLVAAVAMKIQFAYILVLLPLLIWAYSLGAQGSLGSKPWPYRITSILMPLGLGLGLWLLWVGPNLEYFRMVMNAESSGRFGENLELMFRISKYNILNSFWIPELQPLIVSAGIALLLLPFLRKKADAHLWVIALASLFWLLLELHKLPMRYLPNRYLLSTLMPLALLSASVIMMLWGRQELRRFLLIPILACLAAWNLYYNYLAFERRSFELKDTNAYLQASLPDSAMVMGAWAPSLTWGTNAKTIPVWDSYAVDSNLLELYRPDLVISEFNQADSDSAWHRRGCDPALEADSVHAFRLWRMELNAFWMKKAEGNRP